jgi:hypothetical protein
MAATQPIAPSLRELTRLAESADRLSGIGTQIFYAVFAAGAILLLIAVFLPRERIGEVLVTGGVERRLQILGRARKLLWHLGLIILAGTCFVSSQVGVDQRRGFIADQERRFDAKMKKLAETAGKDEVDKAQYLYLPQENSLIYMTLGNTSMASDYIWLTSLQYVSNSFRRGQKFQLLKRFYEIMLELEPHWIEGEANAGKVLSAVQSDRLAVEKYFIKACIANPDDWRMRYEAGMLFVVPPMDPALQMNYSGRAVQWFKSSKRILSRDLNPAPAVVNQIKQIDNLIGKLALESGYYETADEMLWKQAHDPSVQEILRINASR